MTVKLIGCQLAISACRNNKAICEIRSCKQWRFRSTISQILKYQQQTMLCSKHGCDISEKELMMTPSQLTRRQLRCATGQGTGAA